MLIAWHRHLLPCYVDCTVYKNGTKYHCIINRTITVNGKVRLLLTLPVLTFNDSCYCCCLLLSPSVPPQCFWCCENVREEVSHVVFCSSHISTAVRVEHQVLFSWGRSGLQWRLYEKPRKEVILLNTALCSITIMCFFIASVFNA